jgi:hypothetical protein
LIELKIFSKPKSNRPKSDTSPFSLKEQESEEEQEDEDEDGPALKKRKMKTELENCQDALVGCNCGCSLRLRDLR